MKKLLLRIGIVVVVLVVLAVVAVKLFLDSAVKKGIETIGPELTKVSITLDAIHISVLSGSGSVKQLIVGNPEGYKTPTSIKVGNASLALQPLSVLGDKIIVRSIQLESAEITFEGGISKNNLNQILANVDAATSGSSAKGTANAQPAAAPSKGASRKLEVDDFLISGAKLNVSVLGMGTNATTLTLPDIHLTNLGTGPDGITVAELTKQVLHEIVSTATKSAGTALTGLGKGAENVGKSAEGEAGKVSKTIGNLFKKDK